MHIRSIHIDKVLVFAAKLRPNQERVNHLCHLSQVLTRSGRGHPREIADIVGLIGFLLLIEVFAVNGDGLTYQVHLRELGLLLRVKDAF